MGEGEADRGVDFSRGIREQARGDESSLEGTGRALFALRDDAIELGDAVMHGARRLEAADDGVEAMHTGESSDEGSGSGAAERRLAGEAEAGGAASCRAVSAGSSAAAFSTDSLACASSFGAAFIAAASRDASSSAAVAAASAV